MFPLTGFDDYVVWGVVTMRNSKGVPSKPASSRRKIGRQIILGVCAALFLSVLAGCYAVAVVLACCYAVTVVVTAVLTGIGEAIAFISMLSAAIVLFALVAVYWLMEMMALLSAGQLIPFVMRVLQLFGSL